VLEKALAREGIPYRSFSGVPETMAALAQSEPLVVVSDIRMPGGSGLDLLSEIKSNHPHTPVIIMTAYSDLDSAVSAFQGGAFEYLPKPFDVDQALRIDPSRQPGGKRGAHQCDGDAGIVRAVGHRDAGPGGGDAGRVPRDRPAVADVGNGADHRRVGNGKELVARALHLHSPRSGKPFIAINTAAIPKDLLESELFGHERGAFTGAQAQRRGRFEQAEAAPLFLDEIGDMPMDLQVRLCACCRTASITGSAAMRRSSPSVRSSPRHTRT
jgi:two-component system nitrogen regulation response regulator GlnG